MDVPCGAGYDIAHHNILTHEKMCLIRLKTETNHGKNESST